MCDTTEEHVAFPRVITKLRGIFQIKKSKNKYKRKIPKPIVVFYYRKYEKFLVEFTAMAVVVAHLLLEQLQPEVVIG